MALAAWDAASIYIGYNIMYLTRIGRWDGVSAGLAVFAGTWLGVSYLLGRYSPMEDNEGDLVENSNKTLVAAVAVIAVFIGHAWIYQIVDAQTRFRGFLLPLVVGLYGVSMIGQYARNTLFQIRRDWILVGDEKERDVLSKEIGRFGWTKGVVITTASEALDRMVRPGRGSTGLAIGSIEGNKKTDIEGILRLRERGECVVPLISWCEQELQRIPPELIHSDWLVQAEGFGLRPGSNSWRIKRLADITGALVLIGVTAPIVMIATVMIWLEDRGPVFYKQKRTGLFGKPFELWKLRSMKVNAEQNGAQWATKKDKRITRVGGVIRATRIDELPQLFSVLKGDLSLIGPRPERPEIEEDLEKFITNYRMRHWIRPGLSGWAQVCYPYGASVADSRMKLSYDLYYLRNANWPLDILITMKTIKLVLNARGSTPIASEDTLPRVRQD